MLITEFPHLKSLVNVSLSSNFKFSIYFLLFLIKNLDHIDKQIS